MYIHFHWSVGNIDGNTKNHENMVYYKCTCTYPYMQASCCLPAHAYMYICLTSAHVRGGYCSYVCYVTSPMERLFILKIPSCTHLAMEVEGFSLKNASFKSYGHAVASYHADGCFFGRQSLLKLFKRLMVGWMLPGICMGQCKAASYNTKFLNFCLETSVYSLLSIAILIPVDNDEILYEF